MLSYVISFYSFFVNAFPFISEKPEYNVALGCVTRTSVLQREVVTQEQFDSFYDKRWNVKSFFVLRLLERRKDLLPSVRVAKFQEAMNIYYLSGENYIETLRYLQEDCIGPLGTAPYTISTIGDTRKGTLTQVSRLAPLVARPPQGQGRPHISPSPDYALSFSGDRAGATDSYATTTFNPDTYSLWNGFTISFWVRPDEEMNQKSVILGTRASSPVARFHFGFSGAGANNIGVGVGGNDVTGINNPMEVGRWYNWVVSYAGTQHGAGDRKLRLWVNTDERMTNNNSTSWGNQDEGMTMYFGGRNTEGSGYTSGFACALTNVAIYNVCKDSDGTFANEVYNNGIDYNYEGTDDLVGYWRFSEGNGITIADTSGNGNNGTFGAIAGNTTAYPIWVNIRE